MKDNLFIISEILPPSCPSKEVCFPPVMCLKREVIDEANFENSLNIYDYIFCVEKSFNPETSPSFPCCFLLTTTNPHRHENE